MNGGTVSRFESLQAQSSCHRSLVASMTGMGHLRRIDDAGAVSGVPPIASVSAQPGTPYIDPATATGQHRPPDWGFGDVPFIVGGDHATKTMHAGDRHRRKCAGGRLGPGTR